MKYFIQTVYHIKDKKILKIQLLGPHLLWPIKKKFSRRSQDNSWQIHLKFKKTENFLLVDAYSSCLNEGKKNKLKFAFLTEVWTKNPIF